jgi:hypothetical protein
MTLEWFKLVLNLYWNIWEHHPRQFLVKRNACEGLFVKGIRVTETRKDSSAKSIWPEIKQEFVWKSCNTKVRSGILEMCIAIDAETVSTRSEAWIVYLILDAYGLKKKVYTKPVEGCSKEGIDHAAEGWMSGGADQKYWNTCILCKSNIITSGHETPRGCSLLTIGADSFWEKNDRPAGQQMPRILCSLDVYSLHQKSK